MHTCGCPSSSCDSEFTVSNTDISPSQRGGRRFNCSFLERCGSDLNLPPQKELWRNVKYGLSHMSSLKSCIGTPCGAGGALPGWGCLGQHAQASQTSVSIHWGKHLEQAGVLFKVVPWKPEHPMLPR